MRVRSMNWSSRVVFDVKRSTKTLPRRTNRIFLGRDCSFFFELLPAKVANLTDKSSDFAFPDPTSCETKCFTGKELQETPKIWHFC